MTGAAYNSCERDGRMEMVVDFKSFIHWLREQKGSIGFGFGHVRMGRPNDKNWKAVGNMIEV